MDTDRDQTRTKEQTTNNRALPLAVPQFRALNGLLGTLRDSHVTCEHCRTARANTLRRRNGKSSLICRGCASGTPGAARAAAPRPYEPLFFHRAATSPRATQPAQPIVGTITRPKPFRSGRR